MVSPAANTFFVPTIPNQASQPVISIVYFNDGMGAAFLNNGHRETQNDPPSPTVVWLAGSERG